MWFSLTGRHHRGMLTKRCSWCCLNAPWPERVMRRKWPAATSIPHSAILQTSFPATHRYPRRSDNRPFPLYRFANRRRSSSIRSQSWLWSHGLPCPTLSRGDLRCMVTQREMPSPPMAWPITAGHSDGRTLGQLAQCSAIAWPTFADYPEDDISQPSSTSTHVHHRDRRLTGVVNISPNKYHTII